jgi:lysine N6-hydroxylase
MVPDGNEILDFVGVGIGPANLSLAALSAPVPEMRCHFFDQAPEMRWHPGLLFQESVIQTSFLKDLVTPVDPTSKYSFLAFLVAQKRFYSFLTASFSQVTRAEFAQYLAWVSRALPNVTFGTPVHEVDFRDDLWVIRTPGGDVRARDIVLGTGQSPYVPEVAEPHLGEDVLHSNRVSIQKPRIAGRRVAVIGGGQAGAELVNHLLLDDDALPASLLWVTRRDNFSPLDDSAFANELFTPEYSEHFYHLSRAVKPELVEKQKLASDGVSINLLQEIYRRIYVIDFVQRRRPRVTHLLPKHVLTSLRKTPSGITVGLRSQGQHIEREVDVVLLATGHRYRVPPFLKPVLDRIHRIDDQLGIRKDYSVDWDGPANRRIFVQNAARHQRGVADPNLSLLAWRSAVIFNQLANRTVYDCAPSESVIEWPRTSHDPGEQDATAAPASLFPDGQRRELVRGAAGARYR